MSEQEFIDDLDEPVDQSKTDLKCQTCGKVAKTSAGLAGHMRLAHQKPTKQDGYASYVLKAQGSTEEALVKHLEPVITVINQVVSSLGVLSKHQEALEKQQESTKTHVDEALSHLEKSKNSIENFSELNKKLEIVGKLIESVGNGVIMSNSSAQWCLDDIKGLKGLGVECKPFTLEHSKK